MKTTGNASWFCISAKGGERVEVDIFDEIGAWGVTAKDFVTALRKAPHAERVVVNINTPGGDCGEGFTIFDALEALRAGGVRVTVNITGLAASMGSVVMLASDEIRIAENGRVMVHRVTAGGYGNADDLAAVSDVARQFEDRIVALYMKRTGKDEETVRGWMKTPVGTWFFGEEAVEAGFADSVTKGAKAQAFKSEWAAKFEMLPAALFDTPAKPTASEPQSKTIMQKIITALAGALNLSIAPDATEEQLVEAFAAYKPAPATAELDLEDDETKKRFDAAVQAALVDPMKAQADKLAALENELTKIKAAAANGMLGAAGSGTPTPSAGTAPKKELSREEFATLTPRDKAAFLNQGGKLTE